MFSRFLMSALAADAAARIGLSAVEFNDTWSRLLLPPETGKWGSLSVGEDTSGVLARRSSSMSDVSYENFSAPLQTSGLKSPRNNAHGIGDLGIDGKAKH